MNRNINQITHPRVDNVQCVHGGDQEAPRVTGEVTIGGVANHCPLDRVI